MFLGLHGSEPGCLFHRSMLTFISQIDLNIYFYHYALVELYCLLSVTKVF